jgi:hypothetical protein
MKKTYRVDDLRNVANSMLRHSTCSSEMRHGIITLLCEVLHSTGNYQGFRFLTKDEVPYGHMPGINSDDLDPFPKALEKLDTPEHERNFKDTDTTRRQYF